MQEPRILMPDELKPNISVLENDYLEEEQH